MPMNNYSFSKMMPSVFRGHCFIRHYKNKRVHLTMHTLIMLYCWLQIGYKAIFVSCSFT